LGFSFFISLLEFSLLVLDSGLILFHDFFIFDFRFRI
jgi:hypothetical protein